MIKPIVIYLPQFHPIPENDKAWGDGFTEWTNVKKTKPLFDGHYQPHQPHEDVGYYDLRDPEVMVRQAAMAKKYGIYGFAFYHYWFNGKRLLETPLDNMLKSGSPDFPFLYIWANEPWSKRWDGSENEIIQEQNYSLEDDINHIRFLCKNVFSDSRYIKIDGKPVFMVYRTEILPNIIETARIWREEAKLNGYNDLYLIMVENFRDDINPLKFGFDATMEFAPDVKSSPFVVATVNGNTLIDYTLSVIKRSLKPDRDFPWFRCVFPSWDNSARKSTTAGVFVNNSPKLFEQFFYRAIQYTKKHLPIDRQFVFINAWNEWAEGCHIEPDKKFGYAYLKSIKEVIDDKSDINKLEYLKFIEDSLSETLRENSHLKDELNELKNKYNKLMTPKMTKIIKYIFSIYRKIKRRISI